MVDSAAIHDLLADVFRGRSIEMERLRRVSNAPLPAWRRVLSFEGCAPQLDRQFRMRGYHRVLPDALRDLLRESTAASLRLGLCAHRQLTEVAALAGAHGVRVLVVKGAAQLLGGLAPGVRSIADIDLLVAPADGVRFHALLSRELGYTSVGRAYPHHLPVLERPGSLNIDLHVQLSDIPTPLDAEMWSDTRTVMLDGRAIDIPSTTNMLLHSLEHGLALNWTGRYRLRDVLDVAALYTSDVSKERVRTYVVSSPARSACETLLSAAHDLRARVPLFRAHAWRTIRRVSRARLALAALPRDARVAERLFRYAGLIAEGSPRSLFRAGRGVLQRVAATSLSAGAVSVAYGLIRRSLAD